MRQFYDTYFTTFASLLKRNPIIYDTLIRANKKTTEKQIHNHNFNQVIKNIIKLRHRQTIGFLNCAKLQVYIKVFKE